jgi:hypothetical protein
MTVQEAAAAIREIASARAKSPALARSVARAPLRSVYDLCLRSDMSEADLARLKDAGFTLDRAKSTGDPDTYKIVESW